MLFTWKDMEIGHIMLKLLRKFDSALSHLVTYFVTAPINSFYLYCVASHFIRVSLLSHSVNKIDHKHYE